MKKYILIISVTIITIILIKYLPLGLKNKKFKLNDINITIKIPRLSYVTRKNERYIELKSFRSKSSLKKEFKYLNKEFEQYYCNNISMYYDKKRDLTIKEIKYKSDILLNKIQIYIAIGQIPNNDCAYVKDYKKTDYYFKECTGPYGCYGTNEYKYLNTDNDQIYNLYYNHSKYILFKTGLENYNYLTSMLQSGWISMNNVINYLDYQSNKGKITKEIDKNNSFIKYYNRELLVVQCTTDNKDIYIENPSEKDKKDFCIK